MIRYWMTLSARDRADILWSTLILSMWFAVVFGWASLAELCEWFAR